MKITQKHPLDRSCNGAEQKKERELIKRKQIENNKLTHLAGAAQADIDNLQMDIDSNHQKIKENNERIDKAKKLVNGAKILDIFPEAAEKVPIPPQPPVKPEQQVTTSKEKNN